MTDPRSGQPFTPAGAWEFIADRIEAGDEVEVIELHHPPGKSAYVMKLPMATGQPALYVKIELGAGVVFGRSFHDSVHSQPQVDRPATDEV